MAWIEDAEQKVLLVRQAVGLRLWTLPGGKVKRGESLVKALRRELYEETGLRAQIGSLLGVLDRRDKDAITLLFVAVPTKNSIKVKQNNKEIKSADFQASYRRKLHHPPNTFGQSGGAQLRRRPKFELQPTSSPRSHD